MTLHISSITARRRSMTAGGAPITPENSWFAEVGGSLGGVSVSTYDYGSSWVHAVEKAIETLEYKLKAKVLE